MLRVPGGRSRSPNGGGSPYFHRVAATASRTSSLDSTHPSLRNAEHNHALDAEELVIAEAFADEGPTLKRFRPRARGRATRIDKRTSHITIVVSDLSEMNEEVN